MNKLRSVIRGCGAYLPAQKMPNTDLPAQLETNDDWIQQRSGIVNRHLAAPDETTADLAVHAARAALNEADIDPAQIDLIILATATPNQTFPATAVHVQRALGIGSSCCAFDIHAVCSGFVYALATADNFLCAGRHKRALVIGSETFSRILDWQDRGTCVLFGDGAGALVMEAQQLEGRISDRGVLTTQLRSDGRYADLLYVDGGPSTTQTVGKLRMNGREVFRHAVELMSQVVTDTLNDVELSADDIDWFVPHQANRRIIDALARKLNVAPHKVITTIANHANTSAASIPLALRAACDEGKILPGQLVMLEAMGGGFTWGAALLRW